MAERDAAPLTGMSDQNREDSGGTVNVSVYGHQTDTACKDNADSLAAMSMEEVVSRENMLKAYHRVRQNKGAPGVDGITVRALWEHVRARWDGYPGTVAFRDVCASPGPEGGNTRSREDGASGCWGYRR